MPVDGNSGLKDRKGFLEKFLTIFGDIKVYKRPLFLVYDPGSYLVKGEDIREVIRVVQPGDILVRKYKNYLDGFFIPGYFSHVGLYLGPVSKEDVELVSFESGKKQFHSGDQMVMHALAEGVLIEDLLNFCRTDYLAVLRFPEKLKKLPEARSLPVPKSEYITEEEEIQKKMEEGEEIHFKDIFPIIYKVALKNLGRPYDFNFDFATDHALVCTELVWRSYRPDGDTKGLNIDTVNVAGRQTLPANEIAKLYVREFNQKDRQFDFVFFVDAEESADKAFFSEEEAFLKSVERSKWSFAQE